MMKSDITFETIAKQAKKLKRSHKRGREDEDNPDDPEYRAGAH